MVEAAHNGQGQEGKPQISAHALTGEGTKTRNKSQETSTDTLGFYIYTHIHRQTHWDSTLTHTYASNGKGRRPWLRQHTTDWDRKTSHRLATRNKRQEMSTDTLGFHTDTHTHTQANTLGFYTYTRIHKQWEGKETVAEAAHKGQAQEGKPQFRTYALTGEGTQPINTRQAMSTEKLGFYTYTYTRKGHNDTRPRAIPATPKILNLLLLLRCLEARTTCILWPLCFNLSSIRHLTSKLSSPNYTDTNIPSDIY